MMRAEERLMTHQSPDAKPRRMRDERGTSLVIALVFISVFGLLIGSLLVSNSTGFLVGWFRSIGLANRASG